jgi:predicted transcriptional regulator YdeE
MSQSGIHTWLLLVAASLVWRMPAWSQEKRIEPDLAKLVSGKEAKVVNRAVTTLEKEGRPGVRFDERGGNGVGWWPDLQFTDGTLEFDVRGKDAFQKSFVGVAFHGLDEKSYDVVYFRPFNFRATDPARRNHAVQYVALPAYDWQKLRNEHPDKFEQPVAPAPDPDDWFHVRVVVAHPKVSVFVNNAMEPCLTVEQLSDRKRGWVGFWVGNGSGGEFANLKITPSEQSPSSAANQNLNTRSGTGPRIVQRERFPVMGTVTRIMRGTENEKTVAALWKDFEAQHERIRPHSTDPRFYGVRFPTAEEGRFDYLAGMAITPPQTIPGGLVVREVPAATYAVFACPVAGIGQTYRHIFGEWRSASGYQIDNSAPAFEQYPPAEETASPVQIHIPIRVVLAPPASTSHWPVRFSATSNTPPLGLLRIRPGRMTGSPGRPSCAANRCGDSKQLCPWSRKRAAP